jgi:hypothetical protein
MRREKMRKLVICGVLLGGIAIAASFGSCKGEEEPISGTCKSFCSELVSAMDESYYYDLRKEGVAGTKTSCGQDCTEVVNEFKKLDIGSMGDCVSCITDKGFNQIASKPQDEDPSEGDVTNADDWTIGDLAADVYGTPEGDDIPDCYADCDNAFVQIESEPGDGKKDGRLIGRFLADFGTDFAQHYSDATPPCFTTNSDGKRSYYDGDNLCCTEDAPCVDLQINGDCDCDEKCGWDWADCDGTADTDVDTDVDSDSDADTDSSGACDETAYTTCLEDYSYCAGECADTDCTADCLLDYCDCADGAGCWEYVSELC